MQYFIIPISAIVYMKLSSAKSFYTILYLYYDWNVGYCALYRA